MENNTTNDQILKTKQDIYGYIQYTYCKYITWDESLISRNKSPNTQLTQDKNPYVNRYYIE